MNLPHDTTVDEINSLFSRCGVIAEEIDSRTPRIKLYTDEQGTPKGDALVVYFRPESVQLAIQMLDDTDFRFGVTSPEGTIRVKEADFSYKKVKDSTEGGESEKKSEKISRERNKVIKKTQKMNKYELRPYFRIDEANLVFNTVN
jgi:HIV Tat-specific factor 1